MKTLALDTSTLMATCAIIDENNLLAEYSVNQDMTHSENLMPMVDELIENLGISISDIDLFGVAVGPGSFTGLRIGLATVKAFSHVLNKPIVGVSTLEGLAYNLPYNEYVIPIIDARRDRVYTAVYKWNEGRLKTIEKEQVINIYELIDIVNSIDSKNIVINGNGTIEYRDVLKSKLKKDVILSKPSQNVCRASSIAEIAMDKYKNGMEDDYTTLAPVYLRQTQAERDYKK